MTTLPHEGDRLEWIQFLRGIAAFMLVLAHDRFVLSGSAQGSAVAETVLMPMAMGVDLFFMISGFIMVMTTSSFDGSRGYAWTFLAKRIARVWPAYAVACVLALFLFYGANGFYQWSLVKPMLEGLLFIPHDPAASPTYFNMFLDVSWTLCYEFYFYIVFAAAMLFGRRRYLAMAVWFGLTLIIVPLLRGATNYYVHGQAPIASPRYANLAVNPIVWDFVFGMVGAALYKAKSIKVDNRITIGVLLGTVGALLVFWDDMKFAHFHGPIGWGLPVALFFWAMILMAKNGFIHVPRWSVWLGGISYSLYLTHLLVFSMFEKATAIVNMTADHRVSFMFLFRPVAAVLFAWVFFTFVETPLSEHMRKGLLAISSLRIMQRRQTHAS